MQFAVAGLVDVRHSRAMLHNAARDRHQAVSRLGKAMDTEASKSCASGACFADREVHTRIDIEITSSWSHQFSPRGCCSVGAAEYPH
jgi:hypothetical protein